MTRFSWVFIRLVFCFGLISTTVAAMAEDKDQENEDQYQQAERDDDQVGGEPVTQTLPLTEINDPECDKNDKFQITITVVEGDKKEVDIKPTHDGGKEKKKCCSVQ